MRRGREERGEGSDDGRGERGKEGERIVGSGEWGVGSGEWGVGSGEWGVGSGEWGVGSGEWGVGSVNRMSEGIPAEDNANRRGVGATNVLDARVRVREALRGAGTHKQHQD